VTDLAQVADVTDRPTDVAADTADLADRATEVAADVAARPVTDEVEP
jgi:hypothetical protein